MPLDTITSIETRYSCRAFSDKMPSDEDLGRIARAAVTAPSGMNRQLWRVVVVKDKALISDLEAEGMKYLAALPDQTIYNRIMSRGGRLYYNAPCMIVIPFAKADIVKAELVGTEYVDYGIVTDHIALAATSLGLNSLIFGFASTSFLGERGAEFKERLRFPAGFEIGLAVLLGYARSPGGKPHTPDFDKIIWIE